MAPPIAAGVYVALYVVSMTAAASCTHRYVHGSASALQTLLAFFCALNALICYWELALCYRIDVIERDFRKLKERVAATPRGRLGAIRELLATRISTREALSLTFWSRIWSTYALYDDSYANREAYGFWIDVGNGHSTLIPSLLWWAGMTFEVVSPRCLGVVGLLAFYQEFYGTVVYFSQFFFNRRHANKSNAEVFGFIAVANGIWILAPVVGATAALDLLTSNSFALFRP